MPAAAGPTSSPITSLSVWRLTTSAIQVICDRSEYASTCLMILRDGILTTFPRQTRGMVITTRIAPIVSAPALNHA